MSGETTGWVNGVAWTPSEASSSSDPTSSLTLVSGGNDGSVKWWDLRSPRIPLATLNSNQSSVDKYKVLAVDFYRSGNQIVSGGSDCKLSMHALDGNKA